VLRWAALWWLLLMCGHPATALAACSFNLGTATADPASVAFGSTVAISIALNYTGCRNTPLAVADDGPAGVAYAGCSSAGDWNCAGIATGSGVTSSSFTPGNNGNKSGTLELTYTATRAGTRTIILTGSASAASRSVRFEVTAPASPPAATTHPAGDVTRTGATLRGSVTSNGAATSVSFAHGTSIAYGSTVTASPSLVNGSAGETAVSHSLTGLACGTTYHYRVQASNAAGATNGSDTSFTTLPCLPGPTLEYLFNEGAWSGAAGEVRDGSGNAYHGTASGLAGSSPTTATASPALAGPNGSCGYGVFDRAHKHYVALPSAFPNLGSSSSFTITAWIRTTNPALSGQRILADDQSNSKGFAVSLGDGGAGRLRFFQRGGGSSVIMDTGPVIASNTWYFVAAVADIAARSRRLYVFGADGTLLASPGIGYSTASFGSDTGPASVGGETNASGERTPAFGFAGHIDELRVYPAALDREQIDLVRGLVTVCGSSSGPDHYELSMPDSGISCLPMTVTVTACADASSPCTNPYRGAGGHTATLSTSTGTLGARTLGFNALGIATTTLSHPAAADGAIATVALSGETAAASQARQCCQGGRCSNAGSCSSTFSSAGFVVGNAPGGTAVTIPTQAAGGSSGPYLLRAVRSGSPGTQGCAAALSGTTTVNWSYTCNNPTSCSPGNRVTLTGSATTAIAGNANGGGGSSTAVTMTFDADGNAPFSFAYADVGRITLSAFKPAGGALLTALSGSSNAFVVKPAGFRLTDIRCSRYSAGDCATTAIASPGLNPGPVSAAGSAFVPAGSAFSATVTALDAAGRAVPNFGREAVPEGVTLTPTLSWPAGGNPGTLSHPGAFGNFIGGSATGTTFAYSEVGIIVLTPNLASGNYLGSGGAVAGTPSGPVGRFIPHHFTTTVTPACSGSFSYAGQPFAATVTAHNAAGQVVANYSGATGLARTVTLGDGAALGLGSLAANSVAAAAFAAGTASAMPAYHYADKLGAPGTLVLRAGDTDAVSSGGHAEGSTLLRSGRLRVASGSGRETAALQLGVRAEYWSGAAWVLNGNDSCTVVPAAAVALGRYRNHLGAPTSAWATSASAVTLASGSGLLSLAAPAPTASGSLALALNLGSTAADQSCTSGLAASSGAGLPWLRALNGACSGTPDRDPAAQASFGIFSPESRRTVHVRELF
jgi:MSHA biogenesis protein MshQ